MPVLRHGACAFALALACRPSGPAGAPPAAPQAVAGDALSAPATTASELGATALASPASAPPASTAAAPLPLRSATALGPAARVPLQPGTEAMVVDPASRFEIELGAALPDARLVLLDAQDAVVPSTGSREVGSATKLALAPTAPLTPAARYLLRVDGAATREVHDAQGRSYAPLVVPLLAAGTPPAPEQKAKGKRRGARR